jgi:hypothetical protein
LTHFNDYSFQRQEAELFAEERGKKENFSKLSVPSLSAQTIADKLYTKAEIAPRQAVIKSK